MKKYMSFMLASAVCFAAPGGAVSGGAPAKSGKVINKEDLTESGKAAAASAEAAPAAEKGPSKSIVPSKYGDKYRNGGSDELAQFINAQCAEGDKKEFSFAKFFQLARKNGLDEAKVATYEAAVASKARGSEGRARMTLRNMLATPARKNGHLTGLDDKKHTVALPERAPSGAAAKAKEAAADKTAAA